jgi:hypothetical protein
MRNGLAASVALVVTLLVASALPAHCAMKAPKENSQSMQASEHDYGTLNPKAPPELARFAFLLGAYRCGIRLKQADGSWQNLKGTWEGRAILDGYAIADEYRMTTPSGELIVLGMNFRSYDARNKSWQIKWLNALSGTWTDLGTPELGGVEISEKEIRYSMKEPVATHAYTRATYTNISANHFTWRGERSSDNKSWEEFMVIECDRARN